MKILLLSDQECPALYDYYMPGRLDGYDLIISCGDLNSKYLSFIVTMARVPVMYVHGNHDTDEELLSFVKEHRALSVIDEVQGYIRENSDYDWQTSKKRKFHAR